MTDLTNRIKDRLVESWQDGSHVFTIIYRVKGDPNKTLFNKSAYIDAKKYSKEEAEKQIQEWIKKYPNVELSPNHKIGYTSSHSEARWGNQMDKNFAKHQVMVVFYKKGEDWISQEYYRVDTDSVKDAETMAKAMHEKRFPGSKIKNLRWVSASL